MDTNILFGLLLIVPAGLFIYFDKNLLISNKIQTKFKITNFLGLYLFIIITLVLSTILVGTLATILHIPSTFTYALQSIIIGVLLGLFSNILKLIRAKKEKFKKPSSNENFSMLLGFYISFIPIKYYTNTN